MKNSRILLFLMMLLALPAKAADAPYFEKYSFGTAPGMIDFASVITAVPNAVIGELLSRDRILREALGGAGLRYHPLDKGPDAVTLITDGRINATLQSDITMIEMATRIEIVNIGLFKENFGAIVGQRNQPLASLKGKKIATPGGGVGHFTLLQGLDQAGLTEKDVNVVAMNVRDMPDALIAGRIDAFAAFEPAPSTVLARHPERFSILYKHRAPGYMLVTRKLQKENPEAVRQLAAGLARAVRWLRKDRQNLQRASQWAAEAMKAFQGQHPPEREIARMTRTDLIDIREAPALSRSDADENSLIGRNFAFLKKHGRIPADKDWKLLRQTFDTAVMAEVLADPRRFRLDEFRYDDREGASK